MICGLSSNQAHLVLWLLSSYSSVSSCTRLLVFWLLGVLRSVCIISALWRSGAALFDFRGFESCFQKLYFFFRVCGIGLKKYRWNRFCLISEIQFVLRYIFDTKFDPSIGDRVSEI